MNYKYLKIVITYGAAIPSQKRFHKWTLALDSYLILGASQGNTFSLTFTATTLLEKSESTAASC